MESMGIPNTPLSLELTVATPASGNGVHISSSSTGSDGNKGSNSNVENTRELVLLDTFNDHEEVDDAHLTGGSMEIEGGGEDSPPPVGGPSSSLQPRKCNRLSLSREQSALLEAIFQQNQFPDKGAKQALADTLKVELKQVNVWFLNRRARFKKHSKMVQNEKELDSYKRQIESLTNQTHHLRRKIKKLKKKLRLKLLAQSSAPPRPPTAAAAAEELQQQQRQVMYVPVVVAGLLTNGEQNVATTSAATTASCTTQQGSGSATAGLPDTNVLLLQPSSGGSNM